MRKMKIAKMNLHSMIIEGKNCQNKIRRKRRLILEAMEKTLKSQMIKIITKIRIKYSKIVTSPKGKVDKIILERKAKMKIVLMKVKRREILISKEIKKIKNKRKRCKSRMKKAR